MDTKPNEFKSVHIHIPTLAAKCPAVAASTDTVWPEAPIACGETRAGWA